MSCPLTKPVVVAGVAWLAGVIARVALRIADEQVAGGFVRPPCDTVVEIRGSACWCCYFEI